MKSKGSQVSDIDLRLLRVYIAVVESGGFQAAEVVLDKSKSAISMDMSDLEGRLGLVLCKRGRGGFSVTSDGEQVYQAAKQLLSDCDSFRHSVDSLHDSPEGTLRIYLSDNTVFDPRSKLPRILEDFTSRAPKATFAIHGATSKLVTQAVLAGDADIGFAAMASEKNTLDSTLLYQEDLFLYCAEAHPLFSADPGSITLQGLREHDFIEIELINDERMRELLRSCHFTASADQLDARAALILTGKYLGFLPSHLARVWLEQGNLRALMPEEMFFSNNFYSITRKQQGDNPLLTLFLNCIDSAFGIRRN